MGGSSGGGGGTQQTTQKTEPWDEQKPYLKQGFQRAESDVLNRPLEYFPESTVVPFSPEREAGLNIASARAVNGSPLVDAAGQMTMDTLQGNYANPYIDSVADTVAGDAMSAINSQFEGAGRYGSGLHAESLARGVADATAPYRFGAYEGERGRQMAAVDPAMSIANEPYEAAQVLGTVGGMREGLAEQELTDAISRFNFDQSEPTNRLAQYMGLVQGNYGGTSTASGTARSAGGGLSGGDVLGSAAMLGSAAISPTVICTELHRQGLIPDNIMKGDRRFTVKVCREDADVYYGYRMWADPVVSLMQQSTVFTKAVYWTLGPAIRAMAEQGGEGEASRYGRWLLKRLMNVSRKLGKGMEHAAAFA